MGGSVQRNPDSVEMVCITKTIRRNLPLGFRPRGRRDLDQVRSLEIVISTTICWHGPKMEGRHGEYPEAKSGVLITWLLTCVRRFTASKGQHWY